MHINLNFYGNLLDFGHFNEWDGATPRRDWYLGEIIPFYRNITLDMPPLYVIGGLCTVQDTKGEFYFELNKSYV